MIVTETITINGNQYSHTYSNSGYTIERDGVEYSDAIDPLDSGRVYTETKNKIESGENVSDEKPDETIGPDEISAEEFMKLVEEAL